MYPGSCPLQDHFILNLLREVFLVPSGDVGYQSAQGLACGYNFTEMNFSPDFLSIQKPVFIASKVSEEGNICFWLHSSWVYNTLVF